MTAMTHGWWFSNTDYKYHFVSRGAYKSDCGLKYPGVPLTQSNQIMLKINYSPIELCDRCKDFLATINKRKEVKTT